MKTSPRHLLRQGKVLRTLLKTVASAVPLFPPGAEEKIGASQRTILKDTVPPRHPDLVRAYIRHVGGDPTYYRGILPPHMFPQWGFPVMARTLESLPYNLLRVLNGGSRFEILRPLPADQPLLLRARLKAVKDDGNKAVITQQLETGTAEYPKCLVSQVTAIVPLADSKVDKNREKRERPRVPIDSREIARMYLTPTSGLEYGFVTGDINPIHWLAPYARMAGFKNPILHGFSGMARAVESLNRNIWSGKASTLKSMEARFIRPLVLPAVVSIFIDGQGGIFLGKAKGAPATLTGSYTTQ